MSIYKSANDKIVQTGIKAELERKKRFFYFIYLVSVISSWHVICIYACHLNFKLLQINKNRILSLLRREEMFVRILTEWIVTSSGSC